MSQLLCYFESMLHLPTNEIFELFLTFTAKFASLESSFYFYAQFVFFLSFSFIVRETWKYIFRCGKHFSWCSILQLQLIHFIMLMAIKAGDCPSERRSAHTHLLSVTSHSFRKDHLIFPLIVQSYWRHRWVRFNALWIKVDWTHF